MDWETPRNLGDHNSPAAHRPLINLPEEEPGVVTPKPPAVRHTFPLTWKGKNRANLVQVLEAARDSYHHQDFDRAETDFLEALDGHRFLLAPTHEGTVKIAYEIANFYAEQGRIDKANEMLEEVSADFIERRGVGHKKTYQHGLNMVDFLQTWGREDDALALIAHTQDAYERATDESELEPRVTPGKRKRIRETSSSNRLQSIRNEITGNPSSSRIDHGLGTARSYVANGEPGVEDLLKSIEEVCARDRQSYAIQGVQARAELLKLYNQRDVASQHTNVYTSARQLLELSWSQFPWDKKKIRSLDLVEASLEFASGLLRSGVVDSNWMFRKIEDQATDLFGFDDERTIWTLISIGLIHQTWQGWNVARRWFEQALAAALSAHDHTDGIVRSLEAARDNKYFSYISNEGRPFDTVFGVNGITIRPRRLHLE
jgi:tetratricopeptide (TPR) repeat protein